jgi:hypothetical protein
MGALGEFAKNFSLPDAATIGSAYGKDLLRPASRLTAEPLLAKPADFWRPLLFNTIDSRLAGPKGYMDATGLIMPLIDQVFTALKDTEPTQVASFIEEGWRATFTALTWYAGDMMPGSNGQSISRARNTHAMELFRHVALKLADTSTAEKSKKGFEVFYRRTADRVADAAKRGAKPENASLVDAMLHLSTHHEYGVGGDFSLFPMVGDNRQQTDLLGTIQNQLITVEQGRRPAHQVDFVQGMTGKMREYMDAPEVDNQRAWNIGDRAAGVVRSFVGTPLTSERPTAYVMELADRITNPADENAATTGYWNDLVNATVNTRYGITRMDQTKFMDSMNIRHCAVLKAAGTMEPKAAARIISVGEDVLLQKLDQDSQAPLLPLFNAITEPNLLPAARGELLKIRLTDPAEYVTKRMQNLANPNYGVDALHSVAMALERDLRAFVQRAKGLERTEDKKSAAEAAEKILDIVDGQTDIGLRKRIIKLYSEMMTDVDGQGHKPSSLAEADAIQSTQSMRAELAQKLHDLDKAQSQDANSDDRTGSEQLFDQVAESLRDRWRIYFDKMLNSNYGFGTGNDITEILRMKQEALMGEVSKADYDLSGAFVWAGVKEAFMAMKKPARGDNRQRVMFYVLNLLSNSPLAKELIARESSQKGQKATATIRNLQTRAIAELVRDRDLARGMMPYIETKTQRPKDPQEHVLWVIFANALKDSYLTLQDDAGGLRNPDEKAMQRLEGAFIAALENNPELIAGDQIAILELVSSFRSVFPMAIASTADMHIWGRETKNTRKPGTGNKQKEARMAVLGQQLDPNTPEDAVFYTYWNEVGKAPHVDRGLRLPRRAHVNKILTLGLAIPAVKGDALELLERYMGDVCQLTDVPGLVSLSENRKDWDLRRRAKLIDVLLGAVEQVITGEKYNKPDEGKEWMSSTAASVLFITGNALRAWGKEDARLKSHAAERFSKVLIKVIGREGTKNSFAQPISEMAWEVVEQFVPYWSQQDAVKFVMDYVAEGRRNRQGGEASYFANGKLFRILDLITTRGDSELWPVSNETQVIGSLGDGPSPTRSIWVRPQQTEAVMPIMEAIVRHWHSWHTQNMDQRLYEVLPASLTEDGRSVRPVGELPVPAQVMRLTERVGTPDQKASMANFAMTGVQDQLATDIREGMPMNIGALYDHANKLVEGGMKEAVVLMDDVSAMRDTVHRLSVGVIDADFDPATGSLVIRNTATPGSQSQTTLLNRIYAGDDGAGNVVIKRLEAAVQALRGQVEGERLQDGQITAMMILPPAVEKRSPLLRQLRGLVRATHTPAPLTSGVAAVPLVQLGSPYEHLIWASSIAAQGQMGAQLARSLETINRGREAGVEQIMQALRESGRLTTQYVSEQGVQAALNFTTHAIGAADQLQGILRKSPQLLAQATAEQTAKEVDVIKAFLSAQKGVEEAEINRQIQLVEQLASHKTKINA